MANDPIVPISEALLRSIDRLVKLGGVVLAFGCVGLGLVIVAHFSIGELESIAFISGCILIFACFSFIILNSFRMLQLTQQIKEKLPLLDAFQGVVLQILELTSLTQSFTFKHLVTLQKAVESVIPTIESLPIIGVAARITGLTEATKISGAIVSATDNTQEVVVQLQKAIRSGDLEAINRYASQLEVSMDKLKSALKADA